jgi:hypothetical protein
VRCAFRCSGRIRSLAAAGLAAIACAGCVTYERGSLALAAAQPPPLYMQPVADRVQGRSCDTFAERPYAAAVDDALAKAPGADALIDARYRFESLCIVVEGRAVRLRGAGAP